MSHPNEGPSGSQTHSSLGEHRILEFWGCPFAALDDLEGIREMFRAGLEKSDATVIQTVLHQFSPQGVTGVAAIAESHVSIHTWPELGYAAIDVLSCGTKMKTELLLEHFKTVLQPTEVEETRLARGTRLKLAKSV